MHDKIGQQCIFYKFIIKYKLDIKNRCLLILFFLKSMKNDLPTRLTIQTHRNIMRCQISMMSLYETLSLIIDSSMSNGEILRMCVKPTYQGVEPKCQDVAAHDGIVQGVFYWDYDETNPNSIPDPNDLRQEKIARYNEWLSQQNNLSSPELSSQDFSFLTYTPS